ncbi:hypothetical protein K525DRAFT_195943 [Schizophyllum commune Loenen D]|nr:hypothetical protein K525DRAFT_195943 [Schizophyllum commune Loenen D]
MPRAGGTRRPKSGASAGGKGKPKAKGNKSRTIKDVKNTPPGKTSDTRNSNARQELESLIGLRICLITNMMTCPYLVHGIHIFERFEKKVGRWTYDKESHTWAKRVDLDSKGNYEFGEPPHRGDWAFRPRDLDGFVARVRANPDMDYKELCPDGKYELIMYGFPNKHKHLFPRYSTYQRSYRRTTPDGRKLTYEEIYQEYIEHQLDELEVERLILQTGDQGFVLVSHLNLVFVVFDYAMKMKYRLDDPTGERASSEAEETDAQEGANAEETGVQESVNAEEGSDIEELFDDEGEEAWEDMPEDKAYPSGTTVRRDAQSEGAGQSAPIVRPPPRLARSAPEEPLGKQDSRGLDLSSDPPVDEDAIDEKMRMFLIQDNPAHSSTTVERRVHAASAYPSSDAGDPVVGPPQRNTHGHIPTARTSQQVATSSRSLHIRDLIAGKKTKSTNHKTKRTVRFLDDNGDGEHVVLPLAHQNDDGINDHASRPAVSKNPTNITPVASDDGLFTGNNSEGQLSSFEHLALNASDAGVPDKTESPAHSAKATTSTEAVASKSSGGRHITFPARTSGRSVRFAGVGGSHRRANPSKDPIANQSAHAASSAIPPTLSRDPTTAPLPARSTAGHPSAISRAKLRPSDTQAIATSSMVAAASLSNDLAPATRPSQGKKTGDKRTRDDGEDDDDSDGDDDDDGLEILPARRARKKVKAQDVSKSTARMSSNDAAKKGSKSGK